MLFILEGMAEGAGLYLKKAISVSVEYVVESVGLRSHNNSFVVRLYLRVRLHTLRLNHASSLKVRVEAPLGCCSRQK